MAMVVRANKDTNVGGHIASFASAAALYDVGFSHFWKSIDHDTGGDLIFFQGHSVPGRLFPRLHARPPDRGADGQLPPGNRRQGHLLLPAPVADAGFLAVPDRLDGLGPIQAIYQARFMKYLASRGLIDAARPSSARSGPSSATANRRGRIARRHRHGRPRKAGQPDFRHQLQPAAPGRPGARQRQDHPGTRIRIPRRRLERHQADLGHPLGRPVPATRRAS